MKEPCSSSCESADRPIFTFLETARAIERRLEEALDTVNLSGPKFGALSVLVKAEGPLTLSELASRLTCVRSNITQLVDRLEASGLVRRVGDVADRRSVRAEITARGRTQQAKGAAKVQEVESDVARALSGIDPAALQRARQALR